MKIRKALIYLIFFFAAGRMAAQEGISVYEGAQFSYRVDFHDGNQYAWQVFSQLGPPVPASPSEYRFPGISGLNEVEVQWDMAGIYYLTVTESDPSGCSNTRALAVEVLPNNRTIGFDVLAGSECFSPSGNGFDLPVSFLGNNGEELAAEHFPVNVEFTVNGTAYAQVVEHGTQLLQINETMFAANPSQDTGLLVKITGVTDRHQAAIFPHAENRSYTRTIFAFPEIEFTRKMQLSKVVNEETMAHHIMYHPVRVERKSPGADYPGSR